MAQSTALLRVAAGEAMNVPSPPAPRETRDAHALAWGMDPFRRAVLRVVRSVPEGRVVSYGQVALLAGRPGAARAVGAVLRGLREADGDVPWQRVVNARGGISTYKVGHGELQTALLESEGVQLRGERVDMARFGWWPDDDLALRMTGGPGQPT